MKKLISLFLCLTLLSQILSLLPFTVSASAYSGTCGENLTWDFDTATGVITISGTGNMFNYSVFGQRSGIVNNSAPWWEYHENIKKVIISEGVEHIGTCAFYSCEELVEIDLPGSLKSVGSYAFVYNYSIDAVRITDIESWLNISWEFGIDNCYSLYINETLVSSLEIPDSVESINNHAFQNCISLNSIILPNNLTTIGGNAFSGCASLEKINIPGSVTSIGGNAFSGCTKLNEVIIDDGISPLDIGSWSFSGCSSLTHITIPNNVESLGIYVFNGSDMICYNVYDNANYLGNPSNPYLILEQAKDQDIERCNINENTKIISYYAFRSCKNLTYVSVPDGVKTVGEYAFYDCKNLTGTFYGNSYYIGNENNPYLVLLRASDLYITSCEINSETRFIQATAFMNCRNLDSVYISDIAAWCEMSFSDNYSNPFSFADHLYLNGVIANDIIIPNGVTSISDWAFFGCSEIKSVSIPDSVTSIGRYAFSGCSQLNDIAIPAGVTSIGEQAFYGCNSIISAIVDSNNTVFHSDKNCIIKTESKELVFGFKTSEIPNDGSVTSIKQYAFYGIVLDSITIPSSVAFIGYNALFPKEIHVEDLTSWCNCKIKVLLGGYGGDPSPHYHVPVVPTFSSYDLFLNNEKITELVIPDTIDTIGPYQFMCCKSITSLIIPSSVKEIGEGAFVGCENLESIVFSGELKIIGDQAFYRTGITAVNIPSSVVMIGRNSFAFCTELKNVSLSNGVERIDYGAFYGCDLTSVYFPETIVSIGDYAFTNNPHFVSFDVSSKNKTYTSYEGILFSKDMKTLCLCPVGISGEYSIPSGVERIDSLAFFKCSSLNGVIIPENVSFIGYGAFASCENLAYINTPKSLSFIDSFAFYNCSSLSDVYYSGTESEWNRINKTGEYWGVITNDYLLKATIHYLGDEQHIEHVWNDGVTTTPATCKESGIITFTCTVCGETKTEIIEPKGHHYNISKVDPTCTFPGYTIHCCIDCFDTYNTDIISALGHDYSDEFTVDIAPTETSEGLKSRHCSRCDAVTDETVIPKLEITPGDANNDGRVDMRDVLMIRKHILNIQKVPDERFAAADMDGNGVINMRDVLAVRKKILNIK